MTDDVARDPAEPSAASDVAGDRPKRSRRRGRRSKNKPMEGQVAPAEAATEASQTIAPEPPRAAPARASRKPRSQKGGYIPFNDGLDRFVCLDCLRFLPLAYPVQHRRGTATTGLREIARRESEILLCNGLHNGPCLWPDGVVVEPPLSSTNGTTDEQNGTFVADHSPDLDPGHDDEPGFPSDPAAGSAEHPAMQLTE